MSVYKVHMLGFEEPGVIREVTIPEDDNSKDVRTAIWKYGQNMFQDQDICSVSAGDVMEIDGEYHLIMGMGFRLLTEEELEVYKKVEQTYRPFMVMADIPEFNTSLNKQRENQKEASLPHYRPLGEDLK